MQYSQSIKISLALLACVVALASCTTAPPAQSGFLKNYADLKPDRHGNPGLLWWEKPEFNWKKYRRLMLDPVIVLYHSGVKNSKIQSDDLKQLTDEFRNIVITELHGSFPVVETPGPDVLRVRTAITEIIPANPALNALTTVVAFVPLDMGGAAIEAEFIDSSNNEIMATMVERKLGTPFDLKSGFTSLGHARASFKVWAAELKKALETGP